MFSISNNAKIFLYGDLVDLRNGFDGLSFLAQSFFSTSLATDTYFVFINPRRTRMKILSLNRDNQAIWYIRLHKGTFFQPGSLVSSQITQSDLQKIINQRTPNILLRAKKI